MASGQRVADYVRAHPSPLEPEPLHPNHELAAAYQEAFRRHTAWAGELFGGGSAVA